MTQTTDSAQTKNKLKIMPPILAVALALAVFYVLFLRQQISDQNQRLTAFEIQVDNLVADIENASRQRLSLESDLSEMQRQLRDENNRLSAVNQQLSEAEAKIDPDYQQLEQSIRAKVAREFATAAYLSPQEEQLELIKSLSDLSQEELSSLLSLQTEYGGFLDALDVSDQRMTVVVAALQRMLETRQTTMQDLLASNMAEMEQAIANGERPNRARGRAMGEQIMQLSSLENQIETLSYDLTEDELALFQQIQSQQQSQSRQVIRGIRGGPGAAGVFQALPINNSNAIQNLDVQVAPGADSGRVRLFTGFSSSDEISGAVIESEEIIILQNDEIAD